MVVTHDIGIWGAAFYFGDGIRDDFLKILFLHGENFERYVRLFTDGAGVFQIFFPRTLTEKREFVLEPDFQIKCGDGVALLLQETQRYRAVHSTGKENGDIHITDMVAVCWRFVRI